jgi:hypothetical protein
MIIFQLSCANLSQLLPHVYDDLSYNDVLVNSGLNVSQGFYKIILSSNTVAIFG